MKKLLFALLLGSIATASFAQPGVYSNKATDTKKHYGKNILAFNPVHLISENFVGVGFSYERLVNPYLGLKVPVMMAINTNYFNVSLEAKLYPTKNTGPVKYAIAPTIMMGIGQDKREEYVYHQNGTTSYFTSVIPANHFGFLLNQTLNVTISRQFYIGLEGGLGINYYDEKQDNNGSNSNLSFLAQMNIGMGYRF